MSHTKMHPPPEVGTTFYRFDHVPAGDCRVRMDWVKHSVRAIVDREPYTVGKDPEVFDGYRLVVRHWTIRRGWRYEILSEITWSWLLEDDRVRVQEGKPRGDPCGREGRSA